MHSQRLDPPPYIHTAPTLPSPHTPYISPPSPFRLHIHLITPPPSSHLHPPMPRPYLTPLTHFHLMPQYHKPLPSYFHPTPHLHLTQPPTLKLHPPPSHKHLVTHLHRAQHPPHHSYLPPFPTTIPLGLIKYTSPLLDNNPSITLTSPPTTRFNTAPPPSGNLKLTSRPSPILKLSQLITARLP
ncbi:MAG: hypothetical protein RML49_00035 [Verrucomicrobiae bacterium]|nr:hypothetical protein [Verrucomicrobiae bacterium]